MKTRLASISELEYEELSLNVSKHLSQLLNDLDVIQKKLVTGVFAPIEREPKWFLLMPESLRDLTAYPAHEKDKMIYRKAKQQELLVKQDFGVEILGPANTASVVIPEIVIVPGLGFGPDGKRLGRGKGFYDRYFEASPAIKIGIAFEMQIEEDIPTDPHDITMDFVVTDQKIYKTK